MTGVDHYWRRNSEVKWLDSLDLKGSRSSEILLVSTQVTQFIWKNLRSQTYVQLSFSYHYPSFLRVCCTELRPVAIQMEEMKNFLCDNKSLQSPRVVLLTFHVSKGYMKDGGGYVSERVIVIRGGLII